MRRLVVGNKVEQIIVPLDCDIDHDRVVAKDRVDGMEHLACANRAHLFGGIGRNFAEIGRLVLDTGRIRAIESSY